MDPDAGTKKKKRYFQKNKSYTQNRDFVRSLQDAGIILYSEAKQYFFWDTGEGEQEVFTPQLLTDSDWHPLLTVSLVDETSKKEDTNIDDDKCKKEEQDIPTARCLTHILNENNFDKFSSYSDINIPKAGALNIGETSGSSYKYATPLTEPEPPPNMPHIRVI